MHVISFEGFEYSGKSTQIALLKKFFIKEKIASTFTREPGGNKDLEKIRKIQPTIFSKYGNKIFGLLILLYILLIFSFIRIKNE